MNIWGNKLNQRGFTLLEMMIAMTMLAVIVGIMTGTLSLAYKTMEKGEKKIDALERNKIVFPLMEAQIQSAFAGFYAEDGQTKSRFAGEEDSLAFASNYSIWQGGAGNCLVKYVVKTNDQGRNFLYVEEKILGTDVAAESRLTDDYESITFAYYLESSLEEGKWIDLWPEDEKNMPRKIRITFADGLKKKILTADVFVQPRPGYASSVKKTEGTK